MMGKVAAKFVLAVLLMTVVHLPPARCPQGEDYYYRRPGGVGGGGGGMPGGLRRSNTMGGAVPGYLHVTAGGDGGYYDFGRVGGVRGVAPMAPEPPPPPPPLYRHVTAGGDGGHYDFGRRVQPVEHFDFGMRHGFGPPPIPQGEFRFGATGNARRVPPIRRPSSNESMVSYLPDYEPAARRQPLADRGRPPPSYKDPGGAGARKRRPSSMNRGGAQEEAPPRLRINIPKKCTEIQLPPEKTPKKRIDGKLYLQWILCVVVTRDSRKREEKIFLTQKGSTVEYVYMKFGEKGPQRPDYEGDMLLIRGDPANGVPDWKIPERTVIIPDGRGRGVASYMSQALDASEGASEEVPPLVEYTNTFRSRNKDLIFDTNTPTVDIGKLPYFQWGKSGSTRYYLALHEEDQLVEYIRMKFAPGGGRQPDYGKGIENQRKKGPWLVPKTTTPYTDPVTGKSKVDNAVYKSGDHGNDGYIEYIRIDSQQSRDGDRQPRAEWNSRDPNLGEERRPSDDVGEALRRARRKERELKQKFDENQARMAAERQRRDAEEAAARERKSTNGNSNNYGRPDRKPPAPEQQPQQPAVPKMGKERIKELEIKISQMRIAGEDTRQKEAELARLKKEEKREKAAPAATAGGTHHQRRAAANASTTGYSRVGGSSWEARWAESDAKWEAKWAASDKAWESRWSEREKVLKGNLQAAGKWKTSKGDEEMDELRKQKKKEKEEREKEKQTERGQRNIEKQNELEASKRKTENKNKASATEEVAEWVLEREKEGRKRRAEIVKNWPPSGTVKNPFLYRLLRLSLQDRYPSQKDIINAYNRAINVDLIKLERLKDAYLILVDPAQRAYYDAKGIAGTKLYDVLGVDPEAKPVEIKKAYGKLQLLFNPDTVLLQRKKAGQVLTEDERALLLEKTKMVVGAHTTLGDEQNRKRYDETGEQA